MTPTKAAAILDGWAKNAKTDESRAVCEMAAIGMRNAAMVREILKLSGQPDLMIQVINDDGHEQFIVALRNGPAVGSKLLHEALALVLEKVKPL
jgi:hypothetical protein